MSENEQERRETLGDIVSAMHNDAELYHGAWLNDPNENPEADGVSTLLAHYARRIEAAWKRQMSQSWHNREMEELIAKHEKEIAELKKQTGNAAAMRDALSDACYAMFNFLKTQSGGYEEMAIALDKAKAALSEPARNCDVEYADQVEMYYAFKDWCRAKGHTMEPMLAYDAFDWLLAPAAERKGESDGK